MLGALNAELNRAFTVTGAVGFQMTPARGTTFSSRLPILFAWNPPITLTSRRNR